ncbi:MAG: hypothetical protein AB8C84_10775 [Oligoflexales bacterium]
MKFTNVVLLITIYMTGCSSQESYLHPESEGQETGGHTSGSIDQTPDRSGNYDHEGPDEEYLDDETASTPETISGMFLSCAEDPLIENPGAQVAGCMILENDKRSEFKNFNSLEWVVNGSKYRPDCKENSKLWSCLFYLPPKGKHFVTMKRTDLDDSQEITVEVKEEVPDQVYGLWIAERNPSAQQQKPANQEGSSTTWQVDTEFNPADYGSMIVAQSDEKIDLKILDRGEKDEMKCSYQLSETKRIESNKCELELIERSLSLKGDCYEDMSLSSGLDILKSLKPKKCTEILFDDISLYRSINKDSLLIIKEESCLTLVPGLESSDSLSLSKCGYLDVLGVSSVKFEIPEVFDDGGND